jgi:ferredoxin
MAKAIKNRMKKEIDGSNEPANLSRREFIKTIGIGGGALVLLGRFGIHAAAWADSGNPALKMVLVDYAICTGCRTCEAVCSSQNRPVTIDGETLPGLGNLRYANIIHTSARAAGRGGVGCVMGSKKLKAVAVKGTGQPGVAEHKRFLAALEKARSALKNSPAQRRGRSRGLQGPSSQTATPEPRRSGIIARARSWRPTKSAATLPGAMSG